MSKLLNLKSLTEKQEGKVDRTIVWYENGFILQGIHYTDMRRGKAYVFCEIRSRIPSSRLPMQYELSFKNTDPRNDLSLNETLFEDSIRLAPVILALRSEPDTYHGRVYYLQHMADKILQNICLAAWRWLRSVGIVRLE